jgi:hypothetical protein
MLTNLHPEFAIFMAVALSLVISTPQQAKDLSPMDDPTFLTFVSKSPCRKPQWSRSEALLSAFSPILP